MNQEKQPDALKLADEIESWRGDHFCDAVLPAAVELRRLHAKNEQLKAAIGTVCEGWTIPPDAIKILEAALYNNTVKS